MQIEFADLDARAAYRWMISLILPRPIAWVSTISSEGRPNLAPFSFFQGVSSHPPLLMFVPVNTREGGKKDTLRNLDQVPEFVVNLVSADLGEQMNQTAAPLPYGESEFSAAGLTAISSTRVRPPRVAAARAAFECALHQLIPLGDGPGAGTLVLGRIVLAHVDDAALDANGVPDAAKLDLIARMSGDDYCTTRDRFTLQRPG